MARHRLSERAVRTSALGTKISDGGNLVLETTPAGVRLWRYRYRLQGRENTFALGSYPEVTLARARTLRDEAAALVKQGIHPAAQRKLQRQAPSDTLQALCDEYRAGNLAGWSKTHRNLTARVLNTVCKTLGALPVRAITAAHLLPVLQAEAARSPTTAKHLQGIVGAVFRHAVRTLRADADPTQALKGLVKPPPARHKRALTLPELRALWPALPPACKLLALTLCRPSELRLLTPENIHDGVWHLPASGTKQRREHRVPLSPTALALLPGFEPPSTRTLAKELRAAGAPTGFTPHGFRGTGATILASLGFRSELIEHALGHVVGSATSRAYQHSTLIAERAEMLAHFDSAIQATQVVALRA
jgi:integrase